tara:strand:+ start:1842 stop:2069 length:228 start_codon:yes stop_codon:yes gene_type:complete
VARLNLKNLHEITERYDEKLLYALLSEENVTINAEPYDEGLVELFLEFPVSMDRLPRTFLSDKLRTLGWDISERD